MAREIYCSDVKFSDYSLWHRQQHSGVAMCDLDAIEMCVACYQPLILIETVMLKNQELRKGHSMTRKLSIKAGLPAFIVWYKFIGEMPAYVLVKKIAPDYKGGFSSEPVRYTFDQWLNYLEHKQMEHFPSCPKQKLFIEKISKDPRLRRSRIYAPILPV
jgi:hypothetical protein